MLQADIWCETAGRPNDDKIRAHCRDASARLGALLVEAGHLDDVEPAPERSRPHPPVPNGAQQPSQARPIKRTPERRIGATDLEVWLPAWPGPAAPLSATLPTSGANLPSRLARRACRVPALKGWRHAAEAVARMHGMSLVETFEGRGSEAEWRARGHVYFALRIGFGLTLPKIGKRVGRDHSTVLSGLRSHAARLAGV